MAAERGRRRWTGFSSTISTAPNAANIEDRVGHRATGTDHVETGNVTIEQSPHDASTRIVIDHEELPAGVQFTWWVRGKLLEGGEGHPTNDATTTAVNAAPVPANDSGYIAQWNATTPLTISNALANDSDPDSLATTQRYCGIPTSLTLVTGRMCAVLANGTLSGTTLQGGTVTVSADGQAFLYTPPRNHKGPDSFTYKVNGGRWFRDQTQLMSGGEFDGDGNRQHHRG